VTVAAAKADAIAAKPPEPPVKRVSSLGASLWGKVRAKVVLPQGRFSPRPELRPAKEQAASSYLGPKGPDGFPQLADPFGILEPAHDEYEDDDDHDDDHDDDYHDDYHCDDAHDDAHDEGEEYAHHEAAVDDAH